MHENDKQPTKLLRFLWVFCSVILIQSCAHQKVDYDYDTSIDFVAYKSYQWLEKDHTGKTDPRIKNDLLDARIREAIDSTLKQKGYIKLKERSVDFLIAYQMGIEKKTDVDRVHTGIGFGYRFWNVGFGTETIIREYNQVTLYIDIIDPATEKLVWRGARDYRYQTKSTVADKNARINNIVREILAGFPPLRRT